MNNNDGYSKRNNQQNLNKGSNTQNGYNDYDNVGDTNHVMQSTKYDNDGSLHNDAAKSNALDIVANRNNKDSEQMDSRQSILERMQQAKIDSRNSKARAHKHVNKVMRSYISNVIWLWTAIFGLLICVYIFFSYLNVSFAVVDNQSFMGLWYGVMSMPHFFRMIVLLIIVLPIISIMTKFGKWYVIITVIALLPIFFIAILPYSTLLNVLNWLPGGTIAESLTRAIYV